MQKETCSSSLPLAATAAALLLLLVAISLTLAAAAIAALTLVATALTAWGTPLTAVACCHCQHIMIIRDVSHHDRHHNKALISQG